MPRTQKRTYPTGEELKGSLLQRAERVSQLAEISMTEMGQRIANDSSLFHGIKSGKRNLTFKHYDTIMDWLTWAEGRIDEAMMKKKRGAGAVDKEK